MENSPLNKLSGELRNMVYEFVLLDPLPHNLRIGANGALARIKPQCANRLALLCTCRMINAEAGALFYTVNTFMVEDADYVSGRLFEALRARVGNRKADALRSHGNIIVNFGRLDVRDLARPRTIERTKELRRCLVALRLNAGKQPHRLLRVSLWFHYHKFRSLDYDLDVGTGRHEWYPGFDELCSRASNKALGLHFRGLRNVDEVLISCRDAMVAG